MPALRFNFPFYPLKGRFSDPSFDFEGMEEELATLAAKPPGSLTSKDLYLLFNSFLPAGTFEEMAPYLPHAFALLQDDDGLYSHEAPDAAQGELLDSLATWCYVEARELNRHPRLRDAVQEAFMQLFRYWTADIRWHRFSDGHLRPLNALLVDSLLEIGDRLATYHKLTVFPWLLSAHYLPHITALDSIPHAAWTLWVSSSESNRSSSVPPLEIPATTRRRAVEMVEEWLLGSDATPEDMAVWDPILVHHREWLCLFGTVPNLQMV